jgi:hypothetical protein
VTTEISWLIAGVAASPAARRRSVKIKGRSDVDLKQVGVFIAFVLMSTYHARAATVSLPVTDGGRMLVSEVYLSLNSFMNSA